MTLTEKCRFNFAIGAVLPNGAKIHGVKLHPNGGYVVFALYYGAQPWVTWRAGPEGDCYWGHYFKDRADAERDFAERGQ